MTLADQINILVHFHLEERHSGRHLLQALRESDFAKRYIAPEGSIQKSCFFEDISSRGLEQMIELFENLYAKAARQLPKEHAEFGDLTLIALSAMRFCPCTGPIIGAAPRRPRPCRL